METDFLFFQTCLNQGKLLYFIHPHNKFWEVSVQDQNTIYRAGKIKDQLQISSEKIQKRYSSDYVAKRTVKQKIREKMVKGYILLEGSKPNIQEQKRKIFEPKPQILEEKHEKADFKGSITVEQNKKSKKQQKEEKKKIKAVMQQLDQRNKINIKLQQPFKQIEQQLAFPLKHKPSSQGLSVYLVNHQATESILYELLDETKIKISKFVQGQSVGYDIKIFGSNQEAMKFLFGEKEWLKSQNYQEQQCKQQDAIKLENKEEELVAKIQKNSIKNKKKQKKASLVQQTNLSLAPVPRCIKFNNDPLNNKQQPKLGPPSTGLHIGLMLAQTWKQGIQPKGWLMSEKLDGVRCYWTGSEMYSRNGNLFYFPNFFVQNWPKAQLDGQLFIGRGKFSNTLSAIKRNVPVNSMWQAVRFLVFDAPGLKCAFKQRYRILKQVIQKTDNPYIKCHFHRQCKGFQDMFKQLDQINLVGGQGIMLRGQDSLYQFKRSKSLLKVKTFHDDQATIVGYNDGTGKFAGAVGSLKCVNKAGANFDVGSGLNDTMRYNPPKIGQRIVYKYQEFNKDTGRPRFPTFLRMFEDQATIQEKNAIEWVKDDSDEEF